MGQTDTPAPPHETAPHRHAVEFYENDAFLIGTVAGFAGTALRAGDSAVIVATADHRIEFARSMREDGVDVDAAAADGRLISLDAAETLALFTIDGALDADAFHATVGSLLDAAAAGGRQVKVFGEMVALLWDADDEDGATVLEAFWNDLATTRDFQLLCAYPMSAFDDGKSAAFKRICAQHSSVIPTESYSLLQDAGEQQRSVALLQQQAAGAQFEVRRLREEHANLVDQSSDAQSPVRGRQQPTAGSDIPLMARALAGLYAAGGTLVLLSVLLAHTGATDARGSFIVVADAYLVAALLFAWATRLPRWAMPLLLAWGSTLITAVAYFSGAAPSPLIWFYLWIFLYSSYFFSRRQAALQIVVVGIAYGFLLGINPPAGALAWWGVGMGTLLVTATLIWTMRERAEAMMAKLYDAARTDPLTKLLNRRGFRELLDLELERARRSDLQMTVVMGDVDHFKAVNDRFGHQGGDIALQRIADCLESGKRQIDIVSRAGGEEFALILPDTDAAGAFIAAERLRRAVAEEFADDLMPITISFGIATFPGHGETAGSLLRAADDALYRAKDSGRNRCVVFSHHSHSPTHVGPRQHDVEAEHFAAVMLELAAVVDLRFSGSARHSETVGRYAEMMAGELGLSDHRVGRVRLAGLLHDIGKAGIPDVILNKPGPLTDAEVATIRTHPALGAQILEHPSLGDVRGWVAAHHEQPDGRGYPLGLCGPELPIEARIIAVADAYEAMTSDRAYRASIGHLAARAELQSYSGTQFDSHVVAALLAVLDRESSFAGAAA